MKGSDFDWLGIIDGCVYVEKNDGTVSMYDLDTLKPIDRTYAVYGTASNEISFGNHTLVQNKPLLPGVYVTSMRANNDASVEDDYYGYIKNTEPKLIINLQRMHFGGWIDEEEGGVV